MERIKAQVQPSADRTLEQWQNQVRQQQLEAQKAREDMQRLADLAMEKARKQAVDQSIRQANEEVKKAAQDSLKWNAIKEQEQTRLTGALYTAKNQFPEIQNPSEVLKKFDLLESGRAHAKMRDAESGWNSDQTNHDVMSQIAETQRVAQWRQLRAEATAPGSTKDQRQEQMLLYQGLVGSGKPFSGYDFNVGMGGKIINHGCNVDGAVADALVETCKPGMDRKLASTLVPSAICDNNVPEADKLRLLARIKELTAGSNAPLNREQEIFILTQALKADREKQFDPHYADDLAPGHLRSSRYVAPQVTEYLKHDKEAQVEFQTGLMKRLAELKAVEAIDALTAVKNSPTQWVLGKVAEEQLAKITPSVSQLRRDIISNPYLPTPVGNTLRGRDECQPQSRSACGSDNQIFRRSTSHQSETTWDSLSLTAC